MDKVKTETIESYEDAPPPPYEEIVNDADSSESSDEEEFVHQELPRGGLSLPCVIPQTTKSIRGAFFSPFVRAYAPGLAAHDISMTDFLAFVDGLNEAFVAHPVFKGLGTVGAVMQMFYGIDPVQWAGMGLQVTSGFASAATSYTRTRMYIKAMNADLFHPAGLHATILTTKKMMQKVDYPEDKLNLPGLEDTLDLERYQDMKPKEAGRAAAADSAEQDDPRMRRLAALEGYVAPLNYDVPESVKPDNLFRKMGAAQADKLTAKQNRKLNKRQAKSQRLYVKRSKGAERRQERGDGKIEELQKQLVSERAEFEKQVAASGGDSKQQRKVEKEFAKKEKQLNRKMEKVDRKTDRMVEKKNRKAGKSLEKLNSREDKIAKKIRWVVISQWEGEESSDAGSSMSGSDVDPEMEDQVSKETAVAIGEPTR